MHYSDTLITISKYCNIYLKIKLGALSKYCHNILLKNYRVNTFIIKIENELKKLLKDKYEDFVTNMIKSDAVICGSFILESIYGVTWNNTTIDIIVDGFQLIGTNNRKSFSSSKDKENGFQLIGTNKENGNLNYKKTPDILAFFAENYETIKVGTGTHKFSFREKTTNFNPFQWVEYFSGKLPIIDTRTISVSKIKNKVVAHDLDICNNIFSYNTNRIPTLQARAINDITNKSTKLELLDKNGCVKNVNLIKQYHLYKKRGIDVIVDENNILNKLNDPNVKIKYDIPEKFTQVCLDENCIGQLLSIEHDHNKNNTITIYAYECAYF